MLVRNLVSPQMPIPNEPDQWMQFRRLNSRRIAECLEARQNDAMGKMKTLGADGMELIKSAAKAREDAKREAIARGETAPVETEADPIDAYDRDLLLRCGIAAWSYPADVREELNDPDGGLCAASSKWAATEILRFNDLLPADQETRLGN